MRKINVKLTYEAERYCGEATGKMRFTVIETAPFSRIFRGCPLGRDYSEQAALQDYCRRANEDDSSLHLTVRELNIIERVNC